MTDHHCEGIERGIFYNGMPTTTVTDGQSIDNSVNAFVKSFGPEKILLNSPATEVQTWKSVRLYLERQ